MIAQRVCALPGCEITFVPVGRQLYCSMTHAKRSEGEARKQRQHDQRPVVTCAAPGCTNTFVRVRRRKFCSPPCQATVRRLGTNEYHLRLRRAAGVGPKVVHPCEPHGFTPPYRCLDCARDRYAAKRLAENPDWVRMKGAQPRPCAAHGFTPKGQCPRCAAEAALRYRLADPNRKRDSVTMSKIKGALQPGVAFDVTVRPSAVLARLGRACHWCGIETIERDGIRINHSHYPTLDHLLPVSAGGGHTWANVVVACKGCNTEKGSDVCMSCGGPITDLSEPLCATCEAKGRKPKTRYAVCRDCGYVELPGGYCSRCKAKGSGIWISADLSKRDAIALSESMGFDPRGLTLPARTDGWITWWMDAA